MNSSGFVLQNGKNFRQLKKLSMKWLKQLEMTSEHHVTFEQHVLDELEPFAQEVDSYSGDKAFSIDKLLYRLTSNPMCAIVFGRRYNE